MKVVMCDHVADAIDEPERDTLVAEFMRYVNASNQSWPQEGRKPTALMPPNAVVQVQVKQGTYRNCWMVVGVRSGDYANV
ncbi:hypothetical protein L7F22_033803 [Adiantum nelumboides]|nr:hypothetical protein [Adiantum nelumboides]